MNKILVIGLSIFMVLLAQANENTSTYKVIQTDNLTSIIKKQYKGSNLTTEQLMISILAVNPSAFIRGNINALKSNQSLRLPHSKSLKIMDKKSASVLVANHNQHFEERSTKQLAHPFANHESEQSDLIALTKAQEELQEGLGKLDHEREQLRIRVEKLLAEKERMDAELQQLENELQQ